ncbi:MAG: hypothetical protein AABX02_02495, partial [archaeon]
SEWSRQNENRQIEDVLSTFNPPMNDDLLLAFALNAPESFAQNVLGVVESELARHPNESAQKWVVELEDALNGSRRTVLQNLSKHPAMKPFRLLRELVERRNEYVRMQSESHARWKNVEHARNEKGRLEEEWAALTQEQGFETLARLLSSREEMVEKKKRVSMEWLRVWKSVEPVLQNLQEKSARFRQMENAQARTLQLYLANPLSARGKDPHGAGVLMLIRLSVESLEQEGSDLSDVERMESRDVLLECLQNSFFADYFGYSEELDRALEQNGRALDEMPLNARRIIVEQRGASVSQEVETFVGEWDAWEQRKSGYQMELKRLEREADEACQLALGFGLLPLDHS